MDVQAKLDSIQEQKQAVLSITPSQHKSETLSKLYSDVLDAKTKEQNAPYRVIEAEKKYYKFRDGSDGYAEHVKAIYAKESRTVREKMLDNFNKIMEEVDQSLVYYDSERTYLKNMDTVKNTLLEKNKALVEHIQDPSIPTNSRKTYYLQLEQSTIDTWIIFCNCFILISVALLARHQTPPLSIILLLLSSVFILPVLIRWFKKFPYGVNVYTEWGYDPTAKKAPFFYLIPFVTVLVYFIVYKLKIV